MQLRRPVVQVKPGNWRRYCCSLFTQVRENGDENVAAQDVFLAMDPAIGLEESEGIYIVQHCSTVMTQAATEPSVALSANEMIH